MSCEASGPRSEAWGPCIKAPLAGEPMSKEYIKKGSSQITDGDAPNPLHTDSI